MNSAANNSNTESTMQTTNTKKNTAPHIYSEGEVERILGALLGDGCSVTTAAGYALIYDGGTRYLISHADAETMIEILEENPEAYDRACGATRGLHEEDIPADAAKAMRREEMIDDEDDLTWGW